MKVFNNVRSTAETVEPLEINTDKYGAIDTVYERTNIVAISEEDFIGWQYDEIQHTGEEFILKIVDENERLESELNITSMEMLNILTMTNQSLHQEQSEMMMEIMTLISELQGGV